jgi:hypothetical protein
MSRYLFVRDERYFCSLLMYAIMRNPSITASMFGIKLEEFFEIYIESSILRDHWYKLGDPRIYYNKDKSPLNFAREQYLKSLCEILNYDFQELKGQKSYISTMGFVNSPGNYLEKDITSNSIRHLRAMFNMRQDILIVNGDSLNFFEVKVDSQKNTNQIRNYTLLKNLLSPNKNGWAGIKEFDGIASVNLYFITRDGNPIEGIQVIKWNNISHIIQSELRVLKGIDIDSIFKNINF